MNPPVVVVSIDGVTPRVVNDQTMPRLCALARAGASSFEARTVTPPLTLPAHTSMLRSVEPAQHGVFTNDMPVPTIDAAPSFLALARAAGLTTASLVSWRPMVSLIEPDAAKHLRLIDDGYDENDDDVIVADALTMVERVKPDVMFIYLVTPDLAGHTHGWATAPYVEAVTRADGRLATLLDGLDAVLDGLGPSPSVIVTTDHGGNGTHHIDDSVETMETFVVVRTADAVPGSTIASASILDVPPTVAALSGFEPDPRWVGTSLLAKVSDAPATSGA